MVELKRDPFQLYDDVGFNLIKADAIPHEFGVAIVIPEDQRNAAM